ncbi:MAG TPA: hypothetical protein VMN60_11455 [Longimicrobiales bacterium]|nr:hypothetical protein [Longimicrobiales bacterium]
MVVLVGLAIFVMIGRSGGVIITVVPMLEMVILFDRGAVLVGMHESCSRAGEAGQERQGGDQQTGEWAAGHDAKITLGLKSANSHSGKVLCGHKLRAGTNSDLCRTGAASGATSKVAPN